MSIFILFNFIVKAQHFYENERSFSVLRINRTLIYNIISNICLNEGILFFGLHDFHCFRSETCFFICDYFAIIEGFQNGLEAKAGELMLLLTFLYLTF